MTACTACAADLSSLLVCESCGALQEAPAVASPFALLGVEVAQDLDAKALRRRLLQLSRRLHPDFFGSADEATRQLAEHHMAELNSAFEVLEDEFARAARILVLLGAPSEEEERQMPQAFLMEVLEWNEALEEARETAIGSPERQALGALESELTEKRAELMAAVGRALSPLPEPGAPSLTEQRKTLNAVRYVDRALGELRELRLAEASSNT